MDFWMIVVFALLILLSLFFLLNKKKKLSATELKIALQSLEPSLQLAPEHCILEMHKIFVHRLNHLHKKNLKAAEITSIFAKRFLNEKDVWYFHRLRNRIAHEPNFKATRKEAQQAYQTYKKALESLSK